MAAVNEKLNKPITGDIGITAEGWLHIRLDTLLPHCRYGSTSAISDAITMLLDRFHGMLPYFGQAFLVIDEYSSDETRKVFDSDNKGWKAIPNALKGRIFEDDDQFTVSICLLAQKSAEVACHIYVMPLEDACLYLRKRCTLD